MWTDHHAIAATLVHRLHHELVEVVQYVPQVVTPHRQIGRHVAQDGLLAQVVADDLGHERVDGFVVRHSGADRVGQAHPPQSIAGKQSGHAEHRVRTKGKRVEKVVVDAAVDDV